MCTLERSALFVCQHARLGALSAAQQAMAFVAGWRMDTIVLSYLLTLLEGTKDRYENRLYSGGAGH